jgi:carboxyl-terminal processing protease
MIRRLVALSFFLGCSHPADVPPPTPTSSVTVAAAPPDGDERDFTVPPEKFSDAQKSFDEAKKTILEGYYRDSLTEDDLYRAATAGMLERMDPSMHKWNKLLSPSEMAALHSDLKGELVGIGVRIDLDPATGYISVKGTVPGSPAEHAGIAAPDQIVTINGKLYRGLTLHDVVADIRGKPGEVVTLSILRGDKLVTVPVARATVAYDTVGEMVVGGDVGYVRIPSFNEKTPGAVHDALADLAGKKVRALLLDVRHDPGGSYDAAIETAGQMVPAGSTVASLNKRGKIEPSVAKTPPAALLDVPMAILVDHDTASGAELVTAAISELRHATVVGARTHGKWTVQMLDELPNGYAIKYTVALFASPAGKSYEGTGLAPDVEVDSAAGDLDRVLAITDPTKRVAEDVVLRTAVALLAKH